MIWTHETSLRASAAEGKDFHWTRDLTYILDLAMSGAFLTPDSRSDSRQRTLDREIADYHEGIAASSYRWGTSVLVLGMAAVAVPGFHGVADWAVVALAAATMVFFAIRMMMHWRLGNGILCLFCALVVLPGWVFVADDSVKVGKQLIEMIGEQWQSKLGSRGG